MNEAENERAVTGGNMPPEPIAPLWPTADEIAAHLTALFADKLKAAADMRVGMVKIPAIDNADVAANATSYTLEAKAVSAELESARKDHKAPIDALAKVVHEFFKNPNDALIADIRGIEERLGHWARKVRAEEEAKQRRDREAAAKLAREAEAEAQRKRDEAEAAARNAATEADRAAAAEKLVQADEAEKVVSLHQEAAAKPIVTTGVRGSMGGIGVSSKPWAFEVVDPDAIPRGYLTLDEKAIKTAIAEGAREISGLRIYQAERFSVRA